MSNTITTLREYEKDNGSKIKNVFMINSLK